MSCKKCAAVQFHFSRMNAGASIETVSKLRCRECAESREATTRRANTRGIKPRAKFAKLGNVKCARETVRGTVKGCEYTGQNRESPRTLRNGSSASKMVSVIVELVRQKPEWRGNAGSVRRLDAEWHQPGDKTDAQIQRAFRNKCARENVTVCELHDSDGNITDTIPATTAEGLTWFYRCELRGYGNAVANILDCYFIADAHFTMSTTVGAISAGSGAFTASSERRTREYTRERIAFKTDAAHHLRINRAEQWRENVRAIAAHFNLSLPEYLEHRANIACEAISPGAELETYADAIRRIIADANNRESPSKDVPGAWKPGALSPKSTAIGFTDWEGFLRNALAEYAFSPPPMVPVDHREKCEQLANIADADYRDAVEVARHGEIIGSLSIRPLNADTINADKFTRLPVDHPAMKR